MSGDHHVAGGVHRHRLGHVFAAHRAVCDVDTGLGLVRVVEVATTQDVGRVVNLVDCEAQVQGGVAHGIGNAPDSSRSTRHEPTPAARRYSATRSRSAGRSTVGESAKAVSSTSTRVGVNGKA